MSSAIAFETHSITDDDELEFATGAWPGRLSATGQEGAQDFGRRRRGDSLSAVADLRA